MNRSYYCPHLKGEIDEGRCLDINYENIKMKKPQEVLFVSKQFNFTLEDIKHICNTCPNNPL